ncbi:uncharacterized protein LOC141818700 [Curcuma longa]|uniref:uncharacterized protein LOC141818700 n=1 Tax=Curcuma longa TaxID=136217 RepID=UPI003D9FAC07
MAVTAGQQRLDTVECLRGRLLAERVTSKAAMEEVDDLEKRLGELERKLGEEAKCRSRAERRLKLALKRLESLNIVDEGSQLVAQSSSTSSSSSRSSDPERSLVRKSGSITRWSSASVGEDRKEGVDAHRSHAVAVSASCENVGKMETAYQAETEVSRLAIVPAGIQLNLGTCKSKFKDVESVLDALRNIREQLLCSMEVLVVSRGDSYRPAFYC